MRKNGFLISQKVTVDGSAEAAASLAAWQQRGVICGSTEVGCWLVGWLVGWLTQACLVGWLVGWLVDVIRRSLCVDV